MPIVSPWIFYLINLLSNISNLCSILTFVLSLVFSGLILYQWITRLDLDDEIWESFIKWLKRTAIILVISILGLTFIPTKETMYQMLVANYVTDKNIETATDVIKDSVDYIFEKIEAEGEE